MKYICPVCGYPDLDEAPYDAQSNPSYNICSCCGFEYGFDDGSKKNTFKEFREKWIYEGCNWFTKEKKPIGWSLEKQLLNIKNK
jgi:hypothetical protein